VADTSSYDVVLLVEENLTQADATRVHSLHEGIEDPVTYHVLIPLDDGRARVQAAMAASGGLAPDLVPGRPLPLDDIDPEELVEEARTDTERELANAVKVLRATGASATGELVTGDPVDALAAKINAVDPGNLVASLKTVGNGIALLDNSGTGPLAVDGNAIGTALGLAGSELGNNPAVPLVGTDANPQTFTADQLGAALQAMTAGTHFGKIALTL
jgi:hypothetical protein